MIMENKNLSIFNKIFLLRQLPIFKSIGWIDLHYIASCSSFMQVDKGRHIYRKGDPGGAFYCVIFGRLVAYATHDREEAQSQEYIYRGMHFGIISLLTGEPHSMTVEVLNDSLLLCISKENFKNILERIPRLGVEFSYSLSRRMKDRENSDKRIFESTVISVYSPNTGVGNSFYAMHLAFQLRRETRKKIVFVEILKSQECIKQKRQDFFTPKVKTDSHSFEKILNNSSNINDFVLEDPLCSLNFLSVNIESEQQCFSEHVSKFIATLAHEYHYVILDLPSQIDNIIFMVAAQSDEIHIIAQERESDLKRIRTLVENLGPYFKETTLTNRIKVFVKKNNDEKGLKETEISRILNYRIYGKLSFVKEEEIKEAYNSNFLAVGIPSLDHPFTKGIRKISREIAGVRVALVLGGGAALGLSHIGVLDALEKENIPIDLIVGSSIGSVIASFWALGKDARQIESYAKEFRSRFRCLGLIDLIFPASGLISGGQIKRWLRKKIGNASFYQTTVPLKMTAYDIIKREEIILDEGDIVEAVRKSISIPGIIKPIASEGKVFLDGGIFNPLPTNVPALMGIRKIIAVNILKSPYDIQKDYDRMIEKNIQERSWWRRFYQRRMSLNIFNILVNSFLSVDYILADLSARQADIVIHPGSEGICWYEFYRAEELIEKGRKAAYASMSNIKAMMEE